MNKGGRRQRQYKIRDQELLRRGIRRLLDEKFEGKQLRAAKRRLGIKQVELSRLLDKNAKPQAIASKTYAALERLYSQLPGMQPELQKALLSPNERSLLSAYGRWLEEWRLRLSRGYGVRWARSDETVPEPGTAKDQSPIPLRLSERQKLLKKLGRFPNLFDSFNTFLAKRGHSGARVEMAFARIVDPLLDNKDSAFIERSWRELSDDELRKFVKAGIVREQVLLDRSPDVMRAQQVALVVQKPPRPKK